MTQQQADLAFTITPEAIIMTKGSPETAEFHFTLSRTAGGTTKTLAAVLAPSRLPEHFTRDFSISDAVGRWVVDMQWRLWRFSSSRAELPLIQNLFPELCPDAREFILTGISPEEWDELFGDEDLPETSPSPSTPFH